MVHDNGETVLAGFVFTNDIMYEIWHTHTHTHIQIGHIKWCYVFGIICKLTLFLFVFITDFFCPTTQQINKPFFKLVYYCLRYESLRFTQLGSHWSMSSNLMGLCTMKALDGARSLKFEVGGTLQFRAPNSNASSNRPTFLHLNLNSYACTLGI